MYKHGIIITLKKETVVVVTSLMERSNPQVVRTGSVSSEDVVLLGIPGPAGQDDGHGAADCGLAAGGARQLSEEGANRRHCLLAFEVWFRSRGVGLYVDGRGLLVGVGGRPGGLPLYMACLPTDRASSPPSNGPIDLMDR